MTMKGDPREIVARMRHHDNCTAPADRDDECGCLLSNLRAAMTTNSTDAPDMRAVRELIDAVSEWADDPSPEHEQAMLDAHARCEGYDGAISIDEVAAIFARSAAQRETDAPDMRAALDAVVDAARDLVMKPGGLRNNGEALVVVEKADKSDPHYRLCSALERLGALASTTPPADHAGEEITNSVQQDRSRTAVPSIGASNSELEPDDRQDQGNRNPDRQGRAGGEVGGRAALLSGSMQRSECDVRSEDGSNNVTVTAGVSEAPASPTSDHIADEARARELLREITGGEHVLIGRDEAVEAMLAFRSTPRAAVPEREAPLRAAAQEGYRVCAEARHVTLGDKVRDAILSLIRSEKSNG